MRLRFVVVLFALFVITCSGSPSIEGVPCAGEKAPLEVITYNTGLAPGLVNYATPRAPYVVEALKDARWDVMCLQEVWKDADRDAIIAALGLTPEQALFVDTRGKNENPGDRCNAAQIAPLVACVAERCSNESRDERMTICAHERCKFAVALVYFGGGKSCLNCLLANIGESLEGSVSSCLGKGASRIYGGRNGIILLSKAPLRNKEALDVPASGGNRVGLLATVDVAGLSQPLEIACTHLSSPAEIPPTQTDYSDWESEQRAQLTIISSRLLARAGIRPAILMGDLNTSDAVGGLSAVSPSVWGDAMRLGYSNAIPKTIAPFCTECRGNKLVTGLDGDGDAIDHVLIANTTHANLLVPSCAERVFADKLIISGYDYTRVHTNLSDHYGLKVQLHVR